MQRNTKIRSYVWGVVFFIIVMVMGAASLVNLVKFYVNDETDYNEWTVELGNKFETDVTTNFFNKFQFVNLNGALRKLLGQQEMNGVIKLNNGYLCTTYAQCSDEALLLCAERVSNLKHYLEERDIALLYAQTPYTISKYDSQLPTGIVDYGNDNLDRFLAMLEDKGVDIIDFREEMYKDGINQYDMMYKTDHHWTTEAGFYAYQKIEKYLIEKLDCEVDERISDIANYEIENYEKWHLGSNGQRTGIYYAGIDDFNLIVPKFETLIDNNGYEASADKMLYNREPLKNREYTSRYTYDYVLGNALGHFKNPKALNDVKILVVADSMSKCVNPYLIMGFAEVKTILNYESANLTKKLIEEYKPNAVIFTYYSGMVTEETKGFGFTNFSEEE